MPVQFAPTVIPLVEVFHLRDQVLQFCGQRHKHLLTASWPGSGVEDLNVHTVRCREQEESTALTYILPPRQSNSHTSKPVAASYSTVLVNPLEQITVSVLLLLYKNKNKTLWSVDHGPQWFLSFSRRLDIISLYLSNSRVKMKSSSVPSSENLTTASSKTTNPYIITCCWVENVLALCNCDHVFTS